MPPRNALAYAPAPRASGPQPTARRDPRRLLPRPSPAHAPRPPVGRCGSTLLPIAHAPAPAAPRLLVEGKPPAAATAPPPSTALPPRPPGQLHPRRRPFPVAVPRQLHNRATPRQIFHPLSQHPPSAPAHCPAHAAPAPDDTALHVPGPFAWPVAPPGAVSEGQKPSAPPT